MAACNFGSSAGRDRFIRLTRLLIAGGTPILRDVLKLFRTPSSLATALVGTRIGFTKPQKQLVFPPSGSLPNFEDFDISLIFKLLRNCCGLTEPVTKWNELPVESDVSLEADVVRIDFYRNDIYGHTREQMAITNEDFNKYWDIISVALCRMAIHLTGSATALQNEIQGLRFSPLTIDDHRMVEEHLRNIESSLAQQDTKLDNIEAKEDQIQQGIEGIQDTMINAALQGTKISDEKTSPAAAAPVQYNFTYNHFNPNLVVSSDYTQGPPPGLTQRIPRRLSEGTNTQKKPQRPYHKSYSQPSNVGHRRLSSQERCANPEEFQFQLQNPQADEYQQVPNHVFQSPNQTAHTASFYVDQDDSPGPLANEAAAARTWTTNPSYHTSSRDGLQTSPAATTWTPPSNQSLSRGPHAVHHTNSRDGLQTSPAARTWTTPSIQSFSRGLYNTSSREGMQTPPAVATWTPPSTQSFSSGPYPTSNRDDMQTWTPPSNQGFSSGPYPTSNRDDMQTWTPLSNQGFSGGPYPTSNRDGMQTSPAATTWTPPSNQGFSGGPYPTSNRDGMQTSPAATTWTPPSNQGFSGGPYPTSNRDGMQTSPAATTWTPPSNQGFSGGPYPTSNRDGMQTSPAATTWTPPSNQGFSGGPYPTSNRDGMQTSPAATTWTPPSNQGFSGGPYPTSNRDGMQTSPAATTWTPPSNQGFSGGPYPTSNRDGMQTSPAATTWTPPSTQVFSPGPHHTSSGDNRQTSPVNTLVSNKNGWLRQQQQREDQEPLLRINISVGGAGSSGFHLGNMLKSVMDGSIEGAGDISQFTSYLEKHQLNIKKIEGNHNGDSCFIGVSPRDLTSLEDLWRDYIVEDLREFVKETVLPEDFRGEVDVNIDSEEYKRCCKRLRPRGFKDSGRQLHSQSLSQVGMACDVTKPSETIPRSHSVMDLPSTLKNASQELLQLICKHGGRMEWKMAKQQLSYVSYTELTKPAFKQNMTRYLKFLPNNDVQVRLRICPKMRKDSTCSNTNCPDLHLCIYHFLTGSCNFPTNCKNSHDISDDHTNNVFRMANLSFLNDEERKLLLRNVAYVAPEICIYYNSNDPSKSCTKDNCSYLHVCRNWVLVGRVCAAGTWCKRAHTFRNQHEQNILKKKNLDQMSEKEILEKLNEYYS